MQQVAYLHLFLKRYLQPINLEESKIMPNFDAIAMSIYEINIDTFIAFC